MTRMLGSQTCRHVLPSLMRPTVGGSHGCVPERACALAAPPSPVCRAPPLGWSGDGSRPSSTAHPTGPLWHVSRRTAPDRRLSGDVWQPQWKCQQQAQLCSAYDDPWQGIPATPHYPMFDAEHSCTPTNYNMLNQMKSTAEKAECSVRVTSAPQSSTLPESNRDMKAGTLLPSDLGVPDAMHAGCT